MLFLVQAYMLDNPMISELILIPRADLGFSRRGGFSKKKFESFVDLFFSLTKLIVDTILTRFWALFGKC